MTRPMTRIYQSDGTFIDREMNDDEYAQYQLDQEAEVARKTRIANKEAEKQALLDRLGITTDEAKLLLS